MMDTKRVLGRLLFLALGAIALAAMAASAASPEEKKAAGPPRINTITWYEVDPNWPQRPVGVEWGQTSGIAVDASDHVYVFTRAKPPIQVYDAQGKFLRAWGSDLIGAAHYLRIDPKGMIWAVDVGKHVVLRFTPEGKLLKTLGTPGEPGDDERHFNKPTDVAITPTGDLFVSDGYGNRRIVHFDKSGKFIKAWGKEGTGPGEFSLPHSIVVDSKGLLYVADRSNVRIQVFDQAGKFVAQWRNLMVPWELYVTKDDEIWSCGSSPMTWPDGPNLLGCPPKDQVLMRFNTAGKLLQLWTVPKGEDGKENPGELNWLHGLALDSKGNVYACDIMGKRTQKFIRHEGKR